MKKIMVIVVLALLLVGLVSVANASGPVYQPVSQDSDPSTEEPTEAPTEAPTESPTEAPAKPEPENKNNDESEAPKGSCQRAYHYIENTLYNKESGYSILRSEPWCRVWIFLKYGKAYNIPAAE